MPLLVSHVLLLCSGVRRTAVAAVRGGQQRWRRVEDSSSGGARRIAAAVVRGGQQQRRRVEDSGGGGVWRIAAVVVAAARGGQWWCMEDSGSGGVWRMVVAVAACGGQGVQDRVCMTFNTLQYYPVTVLVFFFFLRSITVRLGVQNPM